ncbi:MAG: hypothetical protein ACPG8W_06875, partial [Candidatus Promineifilaceae bacterium]
SFIPDLKEQGFHGLKPKRRNLLNIGYRNYPFACFLADSNRVWAKGEGLGYWYREFTQPIPHVADSNDNNSKDRNANLPNN